MQKIQHLKQRLANNEIIIMDGAMGTEILNRGIPTTLPLWSAEALLQRNLILYGVGGLVAPFLGIKLIDIIITAIHLA